MTEKKGKIYALVVPRYEDIFHSFYASEVIKGVSMAVSRLKIDMLIHISDRFDHSDWLTLPMLDPGFIDAIIFADIDGDLKTLKKVIARDIPYLVMNNYFKEPINCIAIDNFTATVELMDYLIGLGHTKIATISGDLNTQAGEQRLKGYKEALRKHRLTVKEDYIAFGDFLRTPARIAADKLLNIIPRPTAIFAASDIMAMELIDVAKNQGIKVPEDLSVIGFDDNPLNVYSPVALTTVSQPIVWMGMQAVEIMHQIAHHKIKLPVKMLLAAKLIKRQTTSSLK